MISVGIDVSKGKSTICAIKPYGEVLMTPRDFRHTKDDLESLVKQLSRFKEEIHIIMEATGNYHLPICQYLKSRDYQIAIINPLEMKHITDRPFHPVNELILLAQADSAAYWEVPVGETWTEIYFGGTHALTVRTFLIWSDRIRMTWKWPSCMPVTASA